MLFTYQVQLIKNKKRNKFFKTDLLIFSLEAV